jgi:hypothetical protein
MLHCYVPLLIPREPVLRHVPPPLAYFDATAGPAPYVQSKSHYDRQLVGQSVLVSGAPIWD